MKHKDKNSARPGVCPQQLLFLPLLVAQPVARLIPARQVTRHANFQYHDRTIQQLKNSGNLRLIRNQNAAVSITVYDNERIKSLLAQQEGEIDMRRFISNNLAGKAFDFFAWNNMTDSSGKITRPVNNPPLLTSDPALLNEFGFEIVTLKGNLTLTNQVIKSTIDSAKSLVKL